MVVFFFLLLLVFFVVVVGCFFLSVPASTLFGQLTMWYSGGVLFYKCSCFAKGLNSR